MDEIIKERLLRNLKDNADRYFYPDPYTALREMYLEDPEGCVPDTYIGDDLNKTIYDKFYAVFDAIRREVDDNRINLHIDVSYEDSTTVLFVFKNRVLYKDCIKAWNFWWSSEEDLVEELYRIYLLMLIGINAMEDEALLTMGSLKYALIDRMQEDGVKVPEEPALSSLVNNFAAFIEDAMPDWITKQYEIYDVPASSGD
jgi:hypothetical protein